MIRGILPRNPPWEVVSPQLAGDVGWLRLDFLGLNPSSCTWSLQAVANLPNLSKPQSLRQNMSVRLAGFVVTSHMSVVTALGDRALALSKWWRGSGGCEFPTSFFHSEQQL